MSAAEPTRSFRISADTGGTFTDVTVVGPDGRLHIDKALTTYDRMWHGTREALGLVADQVGIPLRELLGRTSLFTWGTTRATNAIVEQRTARTAFLTTEGFPDTLVWREGGKTEAFNLRMRSPAPYVPRRLTFEIRERVGAEGQVVTPLDVAQAEAVLDEVAAAGVEAIAVCLLWSIGNPAHELALGELIERRLPGVPYTLSHAINPIIREYRRASSAAIDASLKPVMQEHVRAMERDMREEGFAGELLMSTCFGGVMTIDDIVAQPVYSVNSGPAMAPVAARVAARESVGTDNAIVCDMGGTSFDVGLVQEGEIKFSRDTWIGAPFVGHLTGFGAVDVKSIGAGGGSIAWIDAGGLLHVGPESARSEPGPVCYGRGGTRPTFTDAAVCLGYVDPEQFLGGRLRLDRDAAARAIEREVAAPLGLTLEQAAHAILAIGNENMVTALADLTVKAGVDPREYVLVAGGGACGLSIGAIAGELGCERVLVPQAASTMSAVGAQFSDVLAEFTASRFTVTSDFPFDAVDDTLAGLERQMDRFVAELSTDTATHVEQRFSVEARYPNQIWEIEVPLPSSRLRSEQDVRAVTELFHRAHERLYAVSEPDQPLECVYWKGRVTAVLPKPQLAVDRAPAAAPLSPRAVLPAYFDGSGVVATPRFDGPAMAVGDRVEGPCVVEEPLTTLVVYPGWTAEVTAAGDYLMTRTTEARA